MSEIVDEFAFIVEQKAVAFSPAGPLLAMVGH
jgi:hypothetical protein